jgi:hypothetical protein
VLLLVLVGTYLVCAPTQVFELPVSMRSVKFWGGEPTPTESVYVSRADFDAAAAARRGTSAAGAAAAARGCSASAAAGGRGAAGAGAAAVAVVVLAPVFVCARGAVRVHAREELLRAGAVLRYKLLGAQARDADGEWECNRRHGCMCGVVCERVRSSGRETLPWHMGRFYGYAGSANEATYR